jgi:hypothetical protein
MKNTKKLIAVLFLSIFIHSCGYTVNKKSLENDFNIKDFFMTGESRINYAIKNDLLLSSNSQSQKLLILNINTKKNRSIKNKNENNEITDYQLTLLGDVTIKFLDNTNEKTFRVTETGNYKVSKYRLDTLNNEKKMIQIMSENMTKKILNRISSLNNDS